MLLEDCGMSIRYPEIRHVEIDSTGKRTVNMTFSCLAGRRVSIEQNQQMKFLMMFALFDLHIDSNHPQLEGKSFSQKYKSLPRENDYNLILRELYRVSKVIRNSLVHNPSSFKILNGYLDVNYSFKETNFRVKISLDSLNSFYTSLVMYIKGDLGKGNYFLGILRSIYREILEGMSEFADEFEYVLCTPSGGLEILPHVREVILKPEYIITNDYLQIKVNETRAPEWQGTDFYLVHEEKDILVPKEALDQELKINRRALLDDWKYEGSFPPLRKDL